MRIEIRSYRSVFDLERRIYRIDRLRLNPGGVPVRGVVYFLAILGAVLIAGGLPVLALAVRALPWYLRDVALPGASAAVLSVIRVEGRPFHLAAQALLRYRSEARAGTGACTWGSSPRSIAPGGRWRMEEILMLPDGSDGRLRRLRYTGPGAVLVTVAHEHVGGRRLRPRLALILRPASRTHGAGDEGRVIGLAPGARMLVRAADPFAGAAAGSDVPGREALGSEAPGRDAPGREAAGSEARQ